MAKKTSEAVDGYDPGILRSLSSTADIIRITFESDAAESAQVKDHYDVVLHHLAALQSAVETHRKAKPE